MVAIEDGAAQPWHRGQRALLVDGLGRQGRRLQQLNLDSSSHHDGEGNRGECEDQPQTPVAEVVHPGFEAADAGGVMGCWGPMEK